MERNNLIMEDSTGCASAVDVATDVTMVVDVGLVPTSAADVTVEAATEVSRLRFHVSYTDVFVEAVDPVLLLNISSRPVYSFTEVSACICATHLYVDVSI